MKDYLTHMSGRIKERVKPLASVGEKNTRDKNNPVNSTSCKSAIFAGSLNMSIFLPMLT